MAAWRDVGRACLALLGAALATVRVTRRSALPVDASPAARALSLALLVAAAARPGRAPLDPLLPLALLSAVPCGGGAHAWGALLWRYMWPLAAAAALVPLLHVVVLRPHLRGPESGDEQMRRRGWSLSGPVWLVPHLTAAPLALLTVLLLHEGPRFWLMCLSNAAAAGVLVFVTLNLVVRQQILRLIFNLQAGSKMAEKLSPDDAALRVDAAHSTNHTIDAALSSPSLLANAALLADAALAVAAGLTELGDVLAMLAPPDALHWAAAAAALALLYARALRTEGLPPLARDATTLGIVVHCVALSCVVALAVHGVAASPLLLVWAARVGASAAAAEPGDARRSALLRGFATWLAIVGAQLGVARLAVCA
jgi:hypothetical protein